MRPSLCKMAEARAYENAVYFGGGFPDNKLH